MRGENNHYPRNVAKQERKTKGRKMIRNVEYFVRGCVGDQNLGEIEDKVMDLAVAAILNFDDGSELDFNPKDAPLTFYNGLERDIFHNKAFNLNDKNIEWENTFTLSDYPISCREDYQASLRRLHIGDILIELTVYRVGQYSYWSARAILVRLAPNIQ